MNGMTFDQSMRTVECSRGFLSGIANDLTCERVKSG
jgi:hypothetical protein